MAMAQTTGTRGTFGEGLPFEHEYAFTYTYFSFADRPEIWMRVNFTTTQVSDYYWGILRTHSMFRTFHIYSELPNATQTFESGGSTATGAERHATATASAWVRYDGATDGLTWAPISLPNNTAFNVWNPDVDHLAIGIEGQNIMPLDWTMSTPQNTDGILGVAAGTDLTGQTQHLFMFHSASDAGVGDRTQALISGVGSALGTPIAMP